MLSLKNSDEKQRPTETRMLSWGGFKVQMSIMRFCNMEQIRVTKIKGCVCMYVCAKFWEFKLEVLEFVAISLGFIHDGFDLILKHLGNYKHISTWDVNVKNKKE